MRGIDWLIVIACLGAGYWLVSALLAPRKPRGPAPAIGDAPAPSRVDAAREATPAAAVEGVTLSNWYRILEVAEDASADEINAAYQRRLQEYSPGTAAPMGPKIQAVAARKTREVRAAYEFGMRLYR